MLTRKRDLWWPLMLALSVSSVCCHDAKQTETNDAFEIRRTESELGVPLLPYPFEPEAFDRVSFHEMAPLDALVTEKPFQGTPPPPSYRTVRIITARSPQPGQVAAYCGDVTDSVCTGGDHFRGAAVDNRRHRYPGLHGMAYIGSDIIVGKYDNERISPALLFRDVGSHTTMPHALAIDKNSKAHLVVSDVVIQEHNRLKVYWVIGDLDARKWLNAYLIQHSTEFTLWSHPKMAATKNSIHLAVETTLRIKAQDITRITYFPWNESHGFSKPISLYEGTEVEFAIAGSLSDDHLLIAISTDNGVYAVARQNGTWQRLRVLLPEARVLPVAVESLGDGVFRIKVSGETNRQFEIKLKAR